MHVRLERPWIEILRLCISYNVLEIEKYGKEMNEEIE